MADASGVRAGRAYVELSVSDKFTKAVEAAEKKLRSLGDSLISLGKQSAALGAAIVAPLLLSANRFAAMGDEINKSSQRTGIAVTALIGLKYAADQSGLSH